MLSLLRTIGKNHPSKAAKMHSETHQFQFESGDAQLHGTLEVAHSPEVAGKPLALLISGSGPIDRDSNMKRQSIDVMRQVAEHLASCGISSFRYDKRGVGQSSGDYASAGLHDNIADARAAIAALRADPRRQDDAMFVVGHSEGALIAGELGATDPTLAGVVLLAGTARPGAEVLRWQAEHVKETLPTPAKVLLRLLRQDVVKTQTKRLEQIRSSTTDTLRIQMVKVNAKWLREFMAHDPSDSLTSVEVPLLAITGSKDVQVNPDDVDRIVDLAGSRAVGHVVEDLTHLLRTEAGPASIRTYKKQAKRPVDRQMLELVSGWMIGVMANRPVGG